MRRILLRSAVALGTVFGLGVPGVAQADTCTFQYEVTVNFDDLPFVQIHEQVVTTPAVTVPCPGPDEQPAPAPVWVTAPGTPGYGDPNFFWARVKKGGRIFFANTNYDLPHAYRGTGFSSGAVPPYGAAEVIGVSSLAVGYYKVRDLDGGWYGDLYIDP